MPTSPEVVMEFLDDISKLINELAKVYKTDIDIIQLQKRFNLVKHNSPCIVYDKIGKYLLKYGAKIMESQSTNNLDFFIKNDYKNDIEDEFSFVTIIICKVKDYVATLDDKKRKKYVDIIFDLYEKYVENS